MGCFEMYLKSSVRLAGIHGPPFDNSFCSYLYQVLEGGGEGGGVGPVRKALKDLLVFLEGDVAHHQVVQEDPQAPHGEAAG